MRRRGFTIAELLAALAIIGILAAAASPLFVRSMRDNRVGNAADEIANLYRVARTRALGRGTCVAVHWDAGHAAPTLSDPAGRFTIREAVIDVTTGAGGGATVVPLPSSNCIGTDWDNDDESAFVASFHDQAAQFSPATVRVFTTTSSGSGGGSSAGSETERTEVEVVFSPRGRTFIRDADTGTSFQVLLSTVRIEVENAQTSFVRQVVIPPNGGARVVTKM